MEKSSIENFRVLVTGGAGFIGSNLVDRLLRLGAQVLVLDDLSSGMRANLPRAGPMKFVRGDVRNPKLMRKLSKEVQIIFHLAEFIPNTRQTGPEHVVKYSMRKTLLDLDVCVGGTLNVLEAARKTNAKVLFASSAAVYGQPDVNPIMEIVPLSPISSYGVSKMAAEAYCHVYAKTYGVPVVTARLFNVYGRRQRKYVMYDLLSRLRRRPRQLKILGSGKQTRDFIYIDDAVEGIILLAAREETYGQAFNLGTGQSTSVRQLVSCLTELLGVTPRVSYTGVSWEGDAQSLIADTRKIMRIGFKPKYTLEQGLTELTKWYRQAVS
jgi:UDP-glucose 4-epimerase